MYSLPISSSSILVAKYVVEYKKTEAPHNDIFLVLKYFPQHSPLKYPLSVLHH